MITGSEPFDHRRWEHGSSTTEPTPNYKPLGTCNIAHVSARKFVEYVPVALAFVLDVPSGYIMKTPAPPFLTALSADPSVKLFLLWRSWMQHFHCPKLKVGFCVEVFLFNSWYLQVDIQLIDWFQFCIQKVSSYAAHSGGWCSDLIREEVQHTCQWHSATTYLSQGHYFNEFGSRACWLSVL